MNQLYTISYDPATKDFRVDFASGAPSIWRRNNLEAEEAARAEVEHERRAAENLAARQLTFLAEAA